MSPASGRAPCPVPTQRSKYRHSAGKTGYDTRDAEQHNIDPTARLIIAHTTEHAWIQCKREWRGNEEGGGKDGGGHRPHPITADPKVPTLDLRSAVVLPGPLARAQVRCRDGWGGGVGAHKQPDGLTLGTYWNWNDGGDPSGPVVVCQWRSVRSTGRRHLNCLRIDSECSTFGSAAICAELGRLSGGAFAAGENSDRRT